jgi:transposase
VYHEAVLFAAHQAGLPVCVEVAKRVKRYLQSIGQYSKNDKLDASGIARLASERQLRSWQPCSEHIYMLRAALRQRKSLIDSKVAFKNQLHAAEYSEVTGKVVKSSIQRLIRQIEREIAKIEAHIEQLYQQDEVLQARLAPIIDSVKGLGLITALTIVAETNGFAQITSRKQLASYAGYDVVENSSGKTQRKTKISKQGNARIRREMYMAAACIIRLKLGPLYQLYERVHRRNPKTYKIANVAVQRKLLLLVYTLYKKQQRFDPNYQDQYANKKGQGQKTSSAGPSPALHEIEDALVALPLEG